jgi:hypothetical protein
MLLKTVESSMPTTNTTDVIVHNRLGLLYFKNSFEIAMHFFMRNHPRLNAVLKGRVMRAPSVRIKESLHLTMNLIGEKKSALSTPVSIRIKDYFGLIVKTHPCFDFVNHYSPPSIRVCECP